MPSTDLFKAYKSAFDHVLTVRHHTPGVIRMEGADRLDFLHRMSTNNLASLAPHRIRSTVFTSPIAQIIDFVEILTREQDLFVITSPGRSQVVHDWLRKHIFFQDDVRIEISPTDWTLWGFYGPASFNAIAKFSPNTEVLESGQLAEVDGGLLWRSTAPHRGYRALLDQNSNAQILEAWESAYPLTTNLTAYQILRIEAGIPEFDREIFEHSIPLEVGLQDAIHFDKGCYIGQEIIARMESRGKLARTLVGVCLDGQVEEGAVIHSEGKKIGEVSSVGYSPRFGWIGLAVVKTSAYKEHLSVSIAQESIRGRLIALPFGSEAGDQQPCFAQDVLGIDRST
jgi:folate-binding protein YgfZ